MAGPIRISVLADGRQANRTFASVGATAGGISARVGRAGKFMGLAFAAGTAVAAAGAVKWAKTSLDSLGRIERINAQTTQTIKSTGGAAGVTAKHVENLAGRLENLTATEAESTQEASNLLLTFTNIRNGVGKANKVFDRTVKVGVDMARALGTEPRANAVQLGKALNDPVKGVSALQRVGVSFTESQKDQIKTLVESGKTMKAQKLILGELEKEFGGSGKAFAKTAEGQKALLGHAFGTLGETIFAPLLPWVTKATSKTTEWVNYLNGNVGPAMAAVKKYVGPVVDAVRGFVDTADSGNSRLKASVGGVLTTYQRFYAAFWPIINGVATAITGEWGTIEPQVRAIWSSVQATVLSALSIVRSIVTVATAVVLAVWGKFGNTLTRFTVTALKATITTLRGAFQIIQGIFQTVAALLRGDWKGVWDGIKTILKGALNVIKGSLSMGLAAVRALASIGFAALKTVASKAFTALVAVVKSQINLVVTVVRGLGKRLVSAIPAPLTLLSDVGSFIVQGLRNGITGAAHLVEDAVSSIINKIPKKIRSLMGIASPSKVLRRLAKWLPAGIAAGLTDGTAGVEKAIEALTKHIDTVFDRRLDRTKKRLEAKYDGLAKGIKKKLDGKAESKALAANERARDRALDAAEKRSNAAHKALLATIKKQLPAIRANAKAQDAIAASIETAKQNLEQLKQQRDDYAASVKDTIAAGGAVTSFGEGTGFGSFDQLAAQRAAAVEKTRRFLEVITKLREQGLNETDIRDLVSKGVDSLGTAETILNGGATAIQQMNTYSMQLNLAGYLLGTSLAQQFYGAGIQAQQGLLNGLLADQAAVEAAATKLGKALVKAVKKELGIKSPSRKFRAISKNVVQGLDFKPYDTYVTRQGQGLAKTLTKGFGAPSLDAWAAAGGGQPTSQKMTIRLTSDQVDQLRRGKEIRADLDAYDSHVRRV